MTASCILTLNAGSSSLKFGLFDTGKDPQNRFSGIIERIGDRPALLIQDAANKLLEKRPLAASEGRTQRDALQTVFTLLQQKISIDDLKAISHRVVHGGPDFSKPVVVEDAVLAQLKSYAPLAPLHQPYNLAAIEASTKAFPEALQIACFDTAFHRHHPWVNDVFALPRRYYDQGIRRYGFHGLSYEYISHTLQQLDPVLYEKHVIIAHLGSGASLCALSAGHSVASTMSFSALDGLPMATRCGQLDPGVVLYLMEQETMSSQEISNLLYKQSGLLGLSGLSGDMRVLEASEQPEAAQAIDYYVFHIRQEIGALTATLGGLDGLIFCGGIGEHSSRIRARICEGLHWLGLALDKPANHANQQWISTKASPIKAMVIPTNEELILARSAAKILQG